MIWRWLLSTQYGVVDTVLDKLFGIRPAWLSDTSLTMLSMCIISIWSGRRLLHRDSAGGPAEHQRYLL